MFQCLFHKWRRWDSNPQAEALVLETSVFADFTTAPKCSPQESNPHLVLFRHSCSPDYTKEAQDGLLGGPSRLSRNVSELNAKGLQGPRLFSRQLPSPIGLTFLIRPAGCASTGPIPSRTGACGP